MKELITLTTLGLMLFAGSAFAQDNTPIRDRVDDRARHFRVPRLVHDKPEVQELLTAFRGARAEFRTQLSALRISLAEASDEQKAEIKADIRELLKSHRIDQARFRKQVRTILRDLRQDRVTDSEG